MAYFGQLTIGSNVYQVGSSLFGISGTNSASADKIVATGTLGTQFNDFIDGITVHVQFPKGNRQETITLKIGSTAALPVLGNAKCDANAVLAFTYTTVNGSPMWVLNRGEQLSITVMDTYDSNSSNPISGKGVAEALAPITGGVSAATLGVDTVIGANPTDTKVPTSKAVADYVDTQMNGQNPLVYKGDIGAGGTLVNVPNSGYKLGYTYRVVSNGIYAGIGCSVGDLIIAIADAGEDQVAINLDHWTIVQAKLVRPVTGPTTATQGHIATFGANGQVIEDSGYTIQTSVPANAVFTDTDTHYEDKGTIQAVVGIEEGNEFTLASSSNGTLHITGGLKITKATASTGIQEV